MKFLEATLTLIVFFSESGASSDGSEEGQGDEVRLFLSSSLKNRVLRDFGFEFQGYHCVA